MCISPLTVSTGGKYGHAAIRNNVCPYYDSATFIMTPLVGVFRFIENIYLPSIAKHIRKNLVSRTWYPIQDVLYIIQTGCITQPKLKEHIFCFTVHTDLFMLSVTHAIYLDSRGPVFAENFLEILADFSYIFINFVAWFRTWAGSMKHQCL